MDRRTFVAILAAGTLATAQHAARAQQAGKIPRVGVLAIVGGEASNLESFYQGLRDLGWVDGQNIRIDLRRGREEQQPAFAADLARQNVAVIVAAGGPAALNAARGATKTIPIVMIVSSSDPVGDGLITSFARPGGNITGIVSVPEEVPAKRLELLQAVVPKLSRVGFLWDATGGPFHVSKAMNDASQSLQIEVLPLEVRDPADFAGVIGAAAKASVGGLIISGTPLFGRNRKQIVELVTNHRLPAIGSWRLWTDAGLLMAYGANFAEEFRRAATYVDKILKGAKPAELPVERPTKFELVINLKAAKALDLRIPQSLLLRADEVIQ